MTIRERALSEFQRYRKEQLGKANGLVQCPYCRKFLLWQESVAVHYIPRQFRSLEVEPMNVFAGHSLCNGIDQQQSNAGEYHERFRQWIIDNYGEWQVLWLENRKRVLVKHGTHFYEDLIEEIRNERRKEKEGQTKEE